MDVALSSSGGLLTLRCLQQSPVGCWARTQLGPSTHKLEGRFCSGACQCAYDRSNSQNGCHQCPWPQGKMQSPSASQGDSPRPEGRSDWGSYHVTALALGPETCEILWVSFKRKDKNKPLYDQLIYNSGGKNIQWRKSLFSKWCWKNFIAAGKRMELEHSLTTYKNKHIFRSLF